MTLDDQGLVLTWNPAAEALFGQARADVLGRDIRVLLQAALGVTARQQFWAALQSQSTQQPTHLPLAQIGRPDGSFFPAETTLMATELDRRRFYTLIVRDRTQQEAVKAELASQHKLVRAALDGVPEVMYIKDIHYRYLMTNAAGLRRVGLPLHAVLGRTDEELFPTEIAHAVRVWDEQVLRTGEPVSYELTGCLADGQSRAFWATKSVYRDNTGQIAGLIGVSLDITERKAAERTIQEYNVTLAKRVEDAQMEILERLARAAELRDDDTGLHMGRVGITAARLARELGLPEQDVQLLRLTAPLHDVGKIGLPDLLLLKPGPLTAEEFEVVKTHTLIGASLLHGGHSDLVNMAEAIACTHHERWDGTGYPYGLQGENIPIVGRIVAVADVLDALTSDRPYRPAWKLDDAMREITAQSGKQFDPAVVAALLRLGRIEVQALSGRPDES